MVPIYEEDERQRALARLGYVPAYTVIYEGGTGQFRKERVYRFHRTPNEPTLKEAADIRTATPTGAIHE